MEDITKMYPYELKQHKRQLERIIEQCDIEEAKWLWSECRICERKEIAKEDIPVDWGWVVGYPALICEVCVWNWNERFGNCQTVRGELYEFSGLETR